MALAAVSLLIVVMVGVVIGGLAAGYRPVVILTGSMGDTAPPGSLLVAAPVDAEVIGPGEILVMRRQGAATVTHRVLEVEANGADRFAITQGDANEVPDATPYPLEGEQLVGRWVVPRAGRWIQTVFQPGLVLALVGLATMVLALTALRRIWATSPSPAAATSTSDGDDPGSTAPVASAPSTSSERPKRRRPKLAVLVVPVVIAGSAGVAWALAAATEPVDANVFGTSDCFDPELASVQSGETVHAINGTVSVPITAVDPTSAFVTASLRSAAAEPADSMVLVELSGGGTTVDLVRATDAGAPPSVVVAWSVIEYACGITVQRGSTNGAGTAQIDIPVTAVDQAASFVLVSSAPASTATTFGANDLFVGELADPSTLRIRTIGSTFPAGQRFSWQVVEFDDGADIAVQTVTANLGVGVASTTATIPTPADRSSTFLISSALSTASGSDIGERLIRTHLVDPTTISVDRGVAGDPVDVQIQVVTLRDGSTVRHGTVDLAAAQPAATVTVPPIDPSRSTAFATVAQPGVSAGGLTDHVLDDVPGEASATFTISDPETVLVTRDATASAASFGWQVIEWAGPRWWDGDYDFRQRIDVDTAATAAPDAYTVPLVVDHAALVSSGLAQSGGDDVRVLRWDGSAWTELDRVLEDGSGWNQTTTTLWFRTTDPIAADTTDTYWLYFGDDSAGPAPADPEAVFLLTENFDSGTLGDFEDRTAGSGWYQALPWTNRVPITVRSALVDAELTDFPLLVSLTSADLGAKAQSDGADIRFTAADGITPLPHEIETYDPGTGALTAWVLVPTLSSVSDTTVYLYYGPSDAPDQQQVRQVWPDQILAAWHLAADPSGSAPQLDDSTVTNHDGLSVGAMTTADLVAAPTGRSVDFDGTDDHLRAGAFDVSGAAELTVSALVNLDAIPVEGRVVAKATDGTTRIVELAVSSTGDLVGRLSLDGTVAELTAGTVPTGSWRHVAMTWDGTTQRLHIDGVEVGSQPAIGAIDRDPAMPVTIGDLAVGGGAVDGRIDEVRIETTARSAAWLAATQSNLRVPGGFASVGAVQTGTWFDQSTWAYRKPIQVEAALVPADQVSYPLLVQITDAQLGAGATVDGRDLVFTSADGVTRLDHLVESWDQGTGALSAWVLLPILSASVNTDLYLYYGNSSADAQDDPVAVFGPEADLVLTGAP